MIYLDHNATTPILPEVADAMIPWIRNNWGNPSSVYSIGREARKAVDMAREQVAALIGADPQQVVFTSGATEANNAALHSAFISSKDKSRIVTSNVEHSAILACCSYLARHRNADICQLRVDSEGRLNPEQVAHAITPDTCLVSLMWANNETGVLFPINQISEICKRHGVPLHCDAVQAVGKIPINFTETGLSYLSLSGHKIGAPKGIGALIVSEPGKFEPFIFGGKQENGLRGGTECVPLIVALGKAAEIRLRNGLGDWDRVRKIRDQFEEELIKRLPNGCVNGGQTERLPNTSNIHVPGMDGDAAVIFLDQRGICVSSGSACLESAITPSHVVLAMTKSHERASESLRISLGEKSTYKELEELVGAIEEFATIAF
jgi:cysteine desulfurase